MSEGSRKRSRKSKLEVRNQDCEYELISVSEKNDDDKTAPQMLQVKQSIERSLVLDHDYCRPGYQVYCPNIDTRISGVTTAVQEINRPAELSPAVKVEVESFNDNGQDIIKMTPIPRLTKYQKNIMNICKYDPEELLKASEEIAAKTNNPADRILDTELRNVWGNVLNTPDMQRPHEMVIQKALVTWQAWYYSGKLVRECPLFYQCHICHLAWWTLQQFRDHIKIHYIDGLRIILKENFHECWIIASYETVSKLIYIDIEGDCWKCGKNFDFHRQNSVGYTCNHCKKSFYTCLPLSLHESTCLYTNIANFNISKDRQCNICNIFIKNLNDVQNHMILSHSVRTDIPVASTYKECPQCQCKYYKYTAHNCPKSSKNSTCRYCCRKFAKKSIATAHMESAYNMKAMCRLCAKPLGKKCLEIEHIMCEHTSNYKLAYRCTLCSDQSQLYVDEPSVRVHRQLWHNKKADRRRSFYESILVPAICLKAARAEKQVQIATETTEQPVIKKEVMELTKAEIPNKSENTENDYQCNVTIKTEPLEETDVNEDTIKIKMEPIDADSNNEMDFETNEMNQTEIETLIVKVETEISNEDIESENIIIKNEIENAHNLNEFGINEDAVDVNPDEMTIDVMDRSGIYKKTKVYVCHKCGYTAQRKQYKIHVYSKCSVSPGHTSHPCTKCGLTFVMFRNYVLHFDTHGYEVMSCPKCGATFEVLQKLLSHVQKHIKTSCVRLHVLGKGGVESSKRRRQFKCQECREVITQCQMFPHWEKHLTLKDSTSKDEVKQEEPELVVDCERVTMNKKSLDPATLRLAIEHLQTTISNEKECVVCYRVFTRRYDLKRHIVEHLLMDAHVNKITVGNALTCQVCASRFPGPEQYKYHMREHGSMPIFKCELCNKTFSDSSNFAKHKKTHNVRVLVCDICKKKFHSRSALQKHILDHSRLGLTECAFCDAKFVTKQAYKQHRHKEHVKIKFRCVLCDLGFSSQQQKWDHNWEVHKERKQNADCPICLKSFRKFQDVRLHARSEHRSDVRRANQARGESLRLYVVTDAK